MPQHQSNSRCADIDSRRALASRIGLDVDADGAPDRTDEGGGGDRPVRVVRIYHGDALGRLVPVVVRAIQRVQHGRKVSSNG